MPESDALTTLLARTRNELSAQFDLSKPYLLNSSPGILDVMGGVSADDEGAIAVQMPIDRIASVLLQTRDDRDLQIFSFNHFDEHVPFTFRMPLDRLAQASVEDLAKGFAEPGRRFAAHVAGCLYLLHAEKLVDLRDPSIKGLSFATYSTIPEGSQLGESSALQAATMKVLRAHFDLTARITDIALAKLCQRVSNEIARVHAGIRQPLASLLARSREMICIDCQKVEILPQVVLPDGFSITGIYSGVRSDNVANRTARLRAASRMAHAIILSVMHKMGAAAGRELVSDPMRGFLCNLDPEDYKRFFRSALPESLTGQDFLSRYEAPSELISSMELDRSYHVLGAADHHILEARRIKHFLKFIEQSRALPIEDVQRFIHMDKAGHLMYASHLSYMNDAQLSSEACDTLVQQLKANEKSGLYGSRMTGQGCGGTVAVLGELSQKRSEAIQRLLSGWAIEDRTRPQLLSPYSR